MSLSVQAIGSATPATPAKSLAIKDGHDPDGVQRKKIFHNRPKAYHFPSPWGILRL